MTRIVPPLALAALVMAVAGGAAHAQSLVGTWSTTFNWNLPSGLMVTSSFTGDGHVVTTTQNHQGQSFLLTGVYQFQNGVLQFKWLDYSPKQICLTYCQPAPAPAPLNVVNTETIRFLNANQFVASGPDGTTVYLRNNTAGLTGP